MRYRSTEPSDSLSSNKRLVMTLIDTNGAYYLSPEYHDQRMFDAVKSLADEGKIVEGRPHERYGMWIRKPV